jgi:zinc protease
MAFRCRLILLAATLVVASLPQLRADDLPRYDFRELTLDNGLRVITLEDFSTPLVNVQLWYHVGSKDEDPERQGFAHMFEHMMFRGTDRLGPTDHFDFIRRTGGTCNAYTSFDQTVYHETLPASQLELALWLEAERMAFLKIDQTSFDTERKIVEEERRMGLNRPFGTVAEKVMAELFRKHPYRWTPIGKIPHLRASEVKELRDFWTRYYVPNNATLVIVGAVKHSEAQQLARRTFGWIPRREDPPRVSVTEELPSTESALTIQEENAPAPLVGMIYRAPSLTSADYIPMQLLTRILVGDNSSRLYRELVVDKKLAVQTLSFDNTLEQDGMLVIGAVLNPLGGKSDPVLEAIRAQIARLRDEPVSERELTKARNQLLKENVVQSLTVEGKAGALGAAAVLEGGAGHANERYEAIRAVTAADLQRVAQKYLAQERGLAMTVPASGLAGGPDKSTNNEDAAPITAQPETEAPAPGRAGVSRPSSVVSHAPIGSLGAVAPTTYEHTVKTLSNGMKLIVVPNHELPYVSVSLGLLAGAWTETKPGTASLALGMLTKGTKNRNEAELADELGTYAITLEGTGGMDTSLVSMNLLTENLDRGMGLLSEVVLTPTFPEDEFTELKKQVTTELTVMAGQPDYIAARELRRKLYGEHPYSRSPAGEPADIPGISLADVRGWWEKFARPDQAVLIFAGDVDSDRAVQLAESHFGKWTADGPKPETKVPEIPAASNTQIILVDRKTATQSQIHVGQLGITRHDPEWFTARVVSSYFGGAFNSRLNEAIRVKRGLTYGARGGYQTQKMAGQFSVSTFSKTESTAETVQAVLDEIKRLRSEAATKKELEDTKSYILGSFALDRETPIEIAGDFWLIESQDLPEDYFQKELAGIAQTSTESCTKLVTDTVDPEKLVIVVVGRAKDIQADLEKIAPVTVIKAK